MTRDEEIQKIIEDIKDISLVLTDPRKWAEVHGLDWEKMKEGTRE